MKGDLRENDTSRSADSAGRTHQFVDAVAAQQLAKDIGMHANVIFAFSVKIMSILVDSTLFIHSLEDNNYSLTHLNFAS